MNKLGINIKLTLFEYDSCFLSTAATFAYKDRAGED
jgi:hypothetical protein